MESNSSPREYDAVLGGGVPAQTTQAKLRIEGASKGDIDAVVERLKQCFDVVEESRDYANRNNSGLRRYVTVRVRGRENM